MCVESIEIRLRQLRDDSISLQKENQRLKIDINLQKLHGNHPRQCTKIYNNNHVRFHEKIQFMHPT